MGVSPKASALSSAAVAAPVHLRVLNGGGYQCAAKVTAAALQKSGYVIDYVNNTGGIDATTIEFPAGLGPEAAALRKLAPRALLAQTSTERELTFVLGGNNVSVTGVDVTTIPATCQDGNE